MICGSLYFEKPPNLNGQKQNQPSTFGFPSFSRLRRAAHGSTFGFTSDFVQSVELLVPKNGHTLLGEQNLKLRMVDKLSCNY